MKLLKVDFVDEAAAKCLEYIQKQWKLETLEIPLQNAFGKILSEDIESSVYVPDFNRSTVDGYAVISGDTHGATESIPSILTLVETIEMGKEANSSLNSGECAYVPTGGMIPAGCDAMVMIEYTEPFSESDIAIYSPVAYRENITMRGEDVKEGEIVIKRGTHLGAKEIGVLAAIGCSKVQIYAPITISVFSTGDEIIEPGEKCKTGQVRDINGYGISAMAQEMGMKLQRHRIIKDDEGMLKSALEEASRDSKIVVLSGGSSQGAKDYSERIIHSMGAPGVFTHGLAIKPGKPTILGAAGGVWYVGLPGHPVSAMIVFDVIVGSVIRKIRNETLKPSPYAKMKTNLASAPGKETYVLAKLSEEEGQWIAEPIHGKSGLITSLSQADGYIVVDKNCEGVRKDEIVKIRQLR
ncbi:MAG: gephyrin-like molybdotransferase Glp [Proteocatella sp.]